MVLSEQADVSTMKGFYYISLLVPIIATLHCILLLKGVEGDNGSPGALGLQILERLQRMQIDMDFLRNRNDELYQKNQQQELEINQIKSQHSKLEDAYYRLFNSYKQIKLHNQGLEKENEKMQIQIRGLQTIVERNGPEVKKNLIPPETSKNGDKPSFDFSAEGFQSLQNKTFMSATNVFAKKNSTHFNPRRELDVSRSISSGSVGFSAILSNAHGADQTISGTIPFDKVLYNPGNCYNQSNGRFVAPVSGVYFFYWHVVSARGTAILVDAELAVNGIGIITARAVNGNAANLVILHVNAGENVWIRTYGGSHKFHCCETSFAGWLLS